MAEERVTFCRICEACCGLVATVDDGRVTRLRPDRDHPLSRGFACPKGIAMTGVQNDPDRVLHPLRRRPDGRFERIAWDTALREIGTRLREIPGESVGWYMGNPGAFSHAHPLWSKGFTDALGSRHYYTASSQDVSNRFAASALLYGSPLVVPIPDLKRTDFLLIVGANPLVSHGSVLTAPRIRDLLGDVVGRGGRVVVVDPRRSETARAFEHVPVRPDGDAWLLLSMLNVIFGEGLEDPHAVSAQARGVEALRLAAADHPPEVTETRTGVPAETVRALARDLAAADRAAVYGRTGSCLGRRGTLVSFLLDALNVVTGNLDRPGGAVFGSPAVALDVAAERAGLATYDSYRSRVGGLPEVIGALPASLMAKEIDTPGAGRLRALFVSAGNPVLSVPAGLEGALERLDLQVGIDFYLNDTHRHADYVLPAATWLEREDFPIAFLSFHTTPFVQWTDPVVEPAGEARDDWEIIAALGREIGVDPFPIRWVKRIPFATRLLSPRRLMDLLLRTGPDGDWFGLRRGGLSVARLRRRPHGVVTAEHVATGVLRRKLRHRDRRVHLDPAAIRAELARLAAEEAPDPAFPLRLIGMRELRSHNSWMHNVPKLMAAGRRHAARVHPADAARAGVAHGDRVRISSKAGTIEVEALVTDEVMEGTIAVPHGWGHSGGWRLAVAAGGANVNALASDAVEDLEPLAGMAHLNGIAVRLQPAASRSAAAETSASGRPAAPAR